MEENTGTVGDISHEGEDEEEKGETLAGFVAVVFYDLWDTCSGL